MKTVRAQQLILVGALLTALVAACGERPYQQAAAPDTLPPAETAPAAPAANPCPDPPPCGDDCSNTPYVANDCWTTAYGPARADVILGDPLKSTNMLYCSTGTYALCFFSGPPYSTGTSSDNPILPCVLQGEKAACTCEAFTKGHYFVDINGILNQGAWYETVAACGQDGSGCANIATCGEDGRKDTCDDLQQAPVCQYVQNQSPTDPAVSLMPGADLISTFSFAMHKGYNLGKKECSGRYAGCMTAACTIPAGGNNPPQDGDLVQCECPTYDGQYQVGQQDQDCTITSTDGLPYVWSASATYPE